MSELVQQYWPLLACVAIVAYLFRDKLQALLNKPSAPAKPVVPDGTLVDAGKITPEEIRRFVSFCDANNLAELKALFIPAAVSNLKVS